MPFLYKEIKEDGIRTYIQRLSDSAYIPVESTNRDYKEFLEKVAELGEENILEVQE